MFGGLEIKHSLIYNLFDTEIGTHVISPAFFKHKGLLVQTVLKCIGKFFLNL